MQLFLHVRTRTPEIFPDDAKAAEQKLFPQEEVISRTRSTTVLAFPGIFRGAFDVRAKEINDEMKLAASEALANLITDEELSPEYIIPKAFDKRVGPAVAKAVADGSKENRCSSYLNEIRRGNTGKS